MSTKPTSTLRWADTGGAIVVPPDGKKNVGHVKGEPPPAEFENWFKNLAGQWAQFIHDRSAIAANADELAIFRNSAGYARETTDRMGYRAGHVVEWVENWSGTALPTPWTGSGTGNESCGAPFAGFPQRFLEQNADSGQTSLVVCEALTYFTENMVYTQEWDVQIPDILNVTAPQVSQGVYSDFGGAPALLTYFYADRDTSANWRCRTGATNEDSLVPLVDNQVYRMKIEIVGDANHGGSNELVRFYIDNALVKTHTPTIADNKIYPAFQFFNPDIAGVMYTNTGRVRCNWNLSLNPTVI